MEPYKLSSPAFLDFHAVCHVLGLPSTKRSRIWMYRNAKSGAFPAPIKLGPAKVAWRAEVIAEFIKSRKVVKYAKKLDRP